MELHSKLDWVCVVLFDISGFIFYGYFFGVLFMGKNIKKRVLKNKFYILLNLNNSI